MTAVALATEALTTCLRQWQETLRTSCSFRMNDCTGKAWICVPFHKPGRITKEVLEGVVVLALLLQHDEELWTRITEEIWPATFRVRAKKPTMAIVWDLGDISELALLRDFITTPENLSARFISTMDAVQAWATTRAGEYDAPRPCVSIRIDGKFPCADTTTLTTAIQPIHQLAVLLAQTTAPGGIKIKIDEVFNVFDAGPSLGLEALRCMADMLDLGICIITLPVLTSECENTSDPADLTRVIRAILCANTSPRVMRRVWVSNASSLRILEAVLSAVQLSSSTFSLCVTWQTDAQDGEELVSQEEYWRLVARYIFSRDARHQIDTLELDLDAFNEVGLRGVKAALEEEESKDVITARVFHLEDPRLRSDSHDLTTFVSPHPIEVLAGGSPTSSELTGWRACQLPGWGFSWIKDSDVMSVSSMEDSGESSVACSVPEIVIKSMTDASMSHVAELVSIIGHETESLTVENHHGLELLDEWTPRVLASCPMVNELRCRAGAYESIQCFVDYAASGTSRLQSLRLFDVFNSDPSGYLGFFQALCDPNHQLTIRLEELNVEFYITEVEINLLTNALIEMLRANRILREICFGFRLRGEAEDLEDELRTIFEYHESEEVAIVTGPLSIREKTAFLSGVPALGQLDSHVIASIFDFAAPTTRRVFSLDFT